MAMKSRDDYEFILLPWEYQGADFDPRPDAVIEDVSTFRREMMLKVKQNYLFFREAGDDPARTCAVLQPLAKSSKEAESLKRSPELLGQIFHEATAKKNWGEMHCFREGLSGFYCIDTIVICFLREDGSGVIREFWDEDGVPFQLSDIEINPFALWRFKFAWLTPRLKVSHEVLKVLRDREVPEQVLQGEPLRWIRGSEQELRQLVTWLLQSSLKQLDEERIRYHYVVNTPVHANRGLTLHLPNNTYVPLPASLQPIIKLILQKNLAVGWKWKASSNPKFCNPTTRDHCEIESYSFGGDVTPPTDDERRVAQRKLRDWLRGQLPEAEIVRLLS